MSVRLIVTGSLAAATLALAGCASSKGSGGSNTPPPAQSSSASTSSASSASSTSSTSSGGSSVAISVGSTSKGMVLTDNGRTLYMFDLDTSTASKCTGVCASQWPPVTGTAMPGSGLSAADFATITRPDGTMQVTYKGHPVYEFSGDKAAGDTNGDGFQGTWHVATVSGAGAPSTPAPSTSTSAGGYTY